MLGTTPEKCVKFFCGTNCRTFFCLQLREFGSLPRPSSQTPEGGQACLEIPKRRRSSICRSRTRPPSRRRGPAPGFGIPRTRADIVLLVRGGADAARIVAARVPAFRCCLPETVKMPESEAPLGSAEAFGVRPTERRRCYARLQSDYDSSRRMRSGRAIESRTDFADMSASAMFHPMPLRAPDRVRIRLRSSDCRVGCSSRRKGDAQ